MTRTLKATDPKAAKPSKPKILIFGAPGAGKTWTSIEFPGVYYIDTEGGADLDHYTDKLKAAGGMYLGPKAGSNDFNVVLEEVITLATTKHKFKTLVIDSYSKLYNTQIDATAERMQKAGRDMEKTFGAEKKEAISMTRRLVRWFEKLDMNVILICHQKNQWKDGKEVGVTFDGHDKLEYELHLAMQIIKTGASRKARITKSRLVGFPDNEIFDWTYASFAERYGKDIIESEVATTELATADQIARYNELMKAVKIDPKIVEKWEENCDDLNDLDRDGMQKRLDYLNKQLPKTA